MSETQNKYILPFFTAITIVTLLAVVQLIPQKPLLLLERIVQGGGWIQIIAAMLYGSMLVYLMQDRTQRAVWRRRAWIFFSIVFFGQLLLGITVDSLFLMSGELHLPIPAIILAGPLYRFEISFMPILFISTVLLSGPAWCSQLCYFGAFDAWLSTGKMKGKALPYPYHKPLRYTLFFLVILFAICFRMAGVSNFTATIFAVILGCTGLAIMFFLSLRYKKMIHCSSFCPLGTLVSFAKRLSPFRIKINTNCTHCMRCTQSCKYDALNLQNIQQSVIGYTCTYCGDCLPACKHNAINYHFARLKPETAEKLWLYITITLHTCFLTIARI